MKTITSANCPVCCSEIEFHWETQEIPYFGEAMLISGVCSCGYRHSDTILLSQKEPSRYILEVADMDDLDARVIRSSSGTVRIPEIGAMIEPGPASECYISNVEGVLDRIRGIVEFTTRSAREAGDPEKTARGEEILKNMDLAMKGQLKLTFILEDPLGNSAVISDKAVKTSLSDEEIENLKTGTIILDI